VGSLPAVLAGARTLLSSGTGDGTQGTQMRALSRPARAA